jgi:hypothetical protein
VRPKLHPHPRYAGYSCDSRGNPWSDRLCGFPRPMKIDLHRPHLPRVHVRHGKQTLSIPLGRFAAECLGGTT